MEALKAPIKEVAVIIVDSGRAFVPAWKRLIRLANDKAVGSACRVRYFYDASKARWKERMIFQTLE